MIAQLWRDFLLALRSLRRNPEFATLVVVVLALGIGANTALFCILDRVLFHPFVYRDMDRLVEVTGTTAKGRPAGVSPAEFAIWESRVPAFEKAAIWKWREILLTGVADPDSLFALEVSGRTFDILGVPPLHGRLFRPADFQPDSPPVVLLGHKLWQQQFHGDPSLVGRPILLDRQSYTVIGIMGPEFVFNRPTFQVWLPLIPSRQAKEELKHAYSAMARLRPGATAEQARKELDSLAGLFPPNPREPDGWRARVRPYVEQFAAVYRTPLYLLWGAVSLVLLIACANAANLILARASSRAREFAVRASLGAGRARLARQIVMEGLALGLAAGLAGVVLATLLLRALVALFPERVPLFDPSHLAIPAPALALTLALVLATTLLCSLPACTDLWRGHFHEALRSGSRSVSASRGANRMRSALVTFEVALSVVLLCGAGLMLRSLSRLMDVHLGFEPRQVLTARVSAPSQLHGREEIGPYFDRLIGDVSGLPGVESAAVVTILPMGPYVVTTSFRTEAGPVLGNEPIYLRSVSTGYFRTLGVRVLRGRAFEQSDTGGRAQVAIVSEELARRFWPGEDPIGKRVSRGENPKPDDWLTVVGVVENTRHRGIKMPPDAELYEPFRQDVTAARATSLVVRTPLNSLSLGPLLNKRIHERNPDQPVTEVKTMDAWVKESLAEPRFHTVQLQIFAGIALVLAVTGVFAVVSYTVNQRKREIGIRSALGATSVALLRYVLALGMRPVLAGTVIGIAGALALARLMESQLYQTAPHDPIVLGGAGLLLAATGMAATLLPCRRAVRIDPSETLRAD